MPRKSHEPILGELIESTTLLLELNPERAALAFAEAQAWDPNDTSPMVDGAPFKTARLDLLTSPMVDHIADVRSTDRIVALGDGHFGPVVDPDRYPIVRDQVARGARIGTFTIAESLTSIPGAFGISLAAVPEDAGNLYETMHLAYVDTRSRTAPTLPGIKPTDDFTSQRYLRLGQRGIDHITNVFMRRTPVLDGLCQELGQGLEPGSPDHDAYLNQRHGMGAAAVAFGIPMLKAQRMVVSDEFIVPFPPRVV